MFDELRLMKSWGPKIAIATLAFLLSQYKSNAEEVQVDGKVTLTLEIKGDESPKKITIESGANSRDVPLAMLDNLSLDISFSSANPREFQATIIEEWEDQTDTSMVLSFAPLDIGKRSKILIFKVRGGLISSDFNEDRLIKDSKKYCDKIVNGIGLLTKKYEACRGIFFLYKESGGGTTKAALRSFRGWFDAYYNLRTNPDSFIARDKALEKQAEDLESLAQSNMVVKSNFSDLHIAERYFSGMNKYLDDDEIKVYNGIKDRIKQKTTEMALKQAKVATDILADKHTEIAGEISKQAGKPITVVNGLERRDIDRLNDIINRRLFR